MRLLAITLGFIFALALVAFVDWLLPLHPQVPGPFRYGIMGHPPKVLTDAPTHIAVHPPAQKSNRLFYQPQLREMIWEATVPLLLDPEIGPHLKGPLTFTGNVIDAQLQKVFFSAKYTLDAANRRVIPNQDLKRPGNFFFFGCSFMFGTGVSEKDTLPAQFAYDQNEYTVYNYSFPGWGPNNLDRLIHLKDFANDVPKKKINQAIYWYIDSHVDRVTLPSTYYRRYSDIARWFPYYYLDSQNHLQTKGSIYDHRGWMNPIYRMFGFSALLSYFNVRFPIPTWSDYKLLAAVIADMRDTLKSKLGVELIVGIFPEAVTGPYLIQELDKKGIRSLNYSYLHAWEYTSKPDWQGDAHPTVSQYRFLAKQMVKDLGLCEGTSCGP